MFEQKLDQVRKWKQRDSIKHLCSYSPPLQTIPN